MASNEERVLEIIRSTRAYFFDDLIRARSSRDALEDWKGRVTHAASADRNVSDDYLGRYPFELLQNIQDSHGSSKVIGRARFVIRPTSLIIADEGDGFVGDKIRSLFYLASTEKRIGESIGHKGLGFRSVLEVSHRPQFHQGGIGWEFNEQKLRAKVREIVPELSDNTSLPYFSCPFEISSEAFDDDQDLISSLHEEGFRMIIRLPYRAGIDANQVRSDLSSISNSQSLIFLPNISEIQIATDSSLERCAIVQREIVGAIGEFRVEFIDLQELSTESSWIAFSMTAEIPEELVEGLKDWEDVRHLPIAIVFRRDSPTSLFFNEAFPIYSFFPTEISTGMSIIFHSMFYLSLDRKKLNPTRETKPLNLYLRDALITFLCDEVVPYIADSDIDNGSLLAALEFSRSVEEFELCGNLVFDVVKRGAD